MGFKSIEKAVKKAAKKRKGGDQFDVGTVIRWTSSGRYTYAAIKTPVGWFTTARESNTFVPQVVTYPDLLEILARDETTDVAVAVGWQVAAESVANTDPSLGLTVGQVKVVSAPDEGDRCGLCEEFH